MANLIVVCGPQAVGKMTVAESLRDKLRYNMMMNHDSIEMSDKIFGFDTPVLIWNLMKLRIVLFRNLSLYQMIRKKENTLSVCDKISQSRKCNSF